MRADEVRPLDVPIIKREVFQVADFTIGCAELISIELFQASQHDLTFQVFCCCSFE